MLAAVCCIKEDNLNILGIKIGIDKVLCVAKTISMSSIKLFNHSGEVGGNKEVNDLAVIYCDSPVSAYTIGTLTDRHRRKQ